ncbi:PilZ domain-containing protein [Sphingomonas humi]|uniref:PilZ domain-containing protein n=1 Tax=Sphingomonas humi TaxID=335630 RepID=A0ABP7RXK5_9SPHN
MVHRKLSFAALGRERQAGPSCYAKRDVLHSPVAPRANRIAVNLPAVMIAADGHETSVIIRDLSSAGFRLEHQDDLFVGDLITLVIAKGERVAATVQWSLGNEAGGRFASPSELSGGRPD